MGGQDWRLGQADLAEPGTGEKPICRLEYTLAHEIAHLLEHYHTERFRQLMDTAMPQWRLYREELNRTPPAHEDWQYRSIKAPCSFNATATKTHGDFLQIE